MKFSLRSWFCGAFVLGLLAASAFLLLHLINSNRALAATIPIPGEGSCGYERKCHDVKSQVQVSKPYTYSCDQIHFRDRQIKVGKRSITVSVPYQVKAICTNYRLETETRYNPPVCENVAKACPPPPSQSSCTNECFPTSPDAKFYCLNDTLVRDCKQDATGCYKKGPAINDCSKNGTLPFTCQSGACIKKSGRGRGIFIPVSERIKLTASLGIGAGGPGSINQAYGKAIPIGVNTPFYIFWQNLSGETPKWCVPEGTQTTPGGGDWFTGWGGKSSISSFPVTGYRGPFSFPDSVAARYSGSYHNFRISCSWPDGYSEVSSNLVSVTFQYNPLKPTCTTGNECSPNQCWNLFQARPCTLDQATGCYKWAPADQIKNCIGGRCDNGTCLGGGGGPTPQPPQPGQQPGQPSQPSTGGGGGTGGSGGTGGAGGTVGGSGTGGTDRTGGGGGTPPTCRPGFDPQCTPPAGGTHPSIVPSPLCTLGVDCPSGCTLGVNCPSGVIPPGGGGGAGAGGGAGGVPGGPVFGATQCSDGVDNDKDGKIDYNGGYLLVDGRKVQVPPDPDCKDSSGQFDWRINSEGFHFREIIPDFFNLNWFKLNFSNFFTSRALGSQ